MAIGDKFKLWVERWGGWLIITIICAIPVVRWFMLNPPNTTFSSFGSDVASIGMLTGLVGFMLYTANFVLAIRFRWLESLFGGLNRVYIAHHITGGVALVLILFHPVLLALQYLEFSMLSSLQTVAGQLIPQAMHFDGPKDDLQKAVGINNGIVASIGMVSLLIIAFFVKLPHALWVFIHKFLGVAYVFAGLHTIFIVSDVYQDNFLKIYYIIWTLIGLACFVYQSIMGKIFIRTAPYRVVAVRHLPSNIVSIILEPTNKVIDFKPGQFVFLRIMYAERDGILSESHPFSISSEPAPNGSIRVHIKALGDFTSSIKFLKPGTMTEIEGAFGRFTPWQYKESPQLWIAGGIGITPLLSAARSYDSEKPPVQLFYSVQNRAELLDQEALYQYLPNTFGNFTYFPYVNSEQPSYLSADYINKVCGVAGKEIFICGPPAMMKSMKAQLRAMGVPKRKIHSEEFSML